MTMGELYNKTLMINNEIEEVGYKLVTVWECEFKSTYPKKVLKMSIDDYVGILKPRDAFYGGRTEPTKLLYDFKSKGQKGRYKDSVSLYPTVNFYDEYPTGHHVQILPDNSNGFLNYDPNWFGEIKCEVFPPRGLYHPVLPYKQEHKGSHKLLFGLCRT